MLREGEQFCLIGPKGRKYLLTWQPSGIFTNQDGKISFAEVTDFGIEVMTNRGVMHQVIKPTAADVALAVKRLTTISYSKDMGFQLLHSTMQAGSTVLECGGGSGAMTSVLARFVGDTGRIHVFERRPEFLELARKNVTKLGLAHRVQWHLRDPAVDGFALEGVEGVEGFEGYDAAFLDVPEPWALVAPAHAVLKPGASVSSLSPNVEQVRATVEKMIEVGFARIWTVELLERELLVRKQGTRPREMMRSHTGYLTFAARFNYSVPPEPNKPRLEGGAESADAASENGEEPEEPIE